MTKSILKEDEIKINSYPTDIALDQSKTHSSEEPHGLRSTLSYMKYKFFRGQDYFTREELWENAKWVCDENAFETQIKLFELDGAIVQIGKYYHLTDKEFDPIICERFVSDKK